MTQDKHTLGPWIYEAGLNEEDIMSCVTSIADGEYDGVAYLTLPNHKANARLIAAAPDMLNALRYADKEFKRLGLPEDCSPRLDIRAAIAKGVGGDQ